MEYREFTIRKKNGKQRRICAPDKELLAYQRSLLPALTAYFRYEEEQKFHDDVFHGFVKNRNCVTAAQKHKGFAHTITLDISNCFDSIKFANIHFAEYFLTPLISEQLTHKDGSLAQGFATSPILANIYLLNPVRALQEMVSEIFIDNAVTVYADDIQISVPESDFATLDYIIESATKIFSSYDLTINKRKTRIRHRKYGNRKILGIQVGDSTLSPNRKLKKKIRAARYQKNYNSLGGLVTSSRLLLPKALRYDEIDD